VAHWVFILQPHVQAGVLNCYHISIDFHMAGELYKVKACMHNAGKQSCRTQM
jgi:hypothetical protein